MNQMDEYDVHMTNMMKLSERELNSEIAIREEEIQKAKSQIVALRFALHFKKMEKAINT